MQRIGDTILCITHAPINVIPHPPVLGLTGKGGGGFVLKILPQGWGNCIITWGLGVGVTSGIGRGFDMLVWPQGWGLCNRKYGKSPPFPHISPRTGGWGITLIGASSSYGCIEACVVYVFALKWQFMHSRCSGVCIVDRVRYLYAKRQQFMLFY